MKRGTVCDIAINKEFTWQPAQLCLCFQIKMKETRNIYFLLNKAIFSLTRVHRKSRYTATLHNIYCVCLKRFHRVLLDFQVGFSPPIFLLILIYLSSPRYTKFLFYTAQVCHVCPNVVGSWVENRKVSSIKLCFWNETCQNIILSGFVSKTKDLMESIIKWNSK